MTIGVILLVLAFTELMIGLRFIFSYERGQASVWYGLFAISVSIYVCFNGLGYTGYVVDGNYAERFAWLGAVMLTTFFLPFVYSFPYSSKKVSEVISWVAWPILIFGGGFIGTELFVKSNKLYNYRSGYQRVMGEYMWVFLVFFFAYWVWSIFELSRRLRKSDGIHKSQIILVLFGIIISLLVSTIFDIILPITAGLNPYGYIGSLFTSAWLIATSYILIKR